MQQGVSPLFVKKGREKEKVFLEIDLLSPNPQPHLITASSLIRRIPCTLEAAVIFSAGKKRKKKKNPPDAFLSDSFPGSPCDIIPGTHNRAVKIAIVCSLLKPSWVACQHGLQKPGI